MRLHMAGIRYKIYHDTGEHVYLVKDTGCVVEPTQCVPCA